MADTDSMITTLLTGSAALLIARKGLAGEIDQAQAMDFIDSALLELDGARRRISPKPQAMQWTIDGGLVDPTTAQMESLNNPDSGHSDAGYRQSMRDAGRGHLV